MFNKQLPHAKVRRTLPLVPNPWAPYGAQGLGSSVLIWYDEQSEPLYRFENGFQTPISIVDWSSDGNIVLAGSMTGEVLAWQVATGERVLANRHGHSYAPIVGISWAPGGRHVVAITMASTIQIWQVATRICLVLPCQSKTTSIRWELDGSSFRTNDGIAWFGQEGEQA